MTKTNFTKTCSKCKKVKPIDEFGVESRRPDGRRCFCLSCGWKDTKAHRIRTRAAHLQSRKKYDFKYRFGIDLKAYAAMWAAQGQRCAICKRPRRNGERRFPADRDRGIVCLACKIAIGKQKERGHV